MSPDRKTSQSDCQPLVHAHKPGKSARSFLIAVLASHERAYHAALENCRSDETGENVHALRVAARKLRGCIKLVKHLQPDAKTLRLANDAKLMAQALNKVRELDVLIADWQQHQSPGENMDAQSVLRVLQEQRASAMQAWHAHLAAAPNILSLEEARKRKTKPATINQLALDLTSPSLSASVEEVARQLLDRLHRKVRNKAKGYRHFSNEQRHDLRISVKNLRYGVEALAALFGHDQRKQKLLKYATHLQEALGICNDAQSARQHILSVTDSLDDAARSQGQDFLTGLQKRARKAEGTIGKRWQRLKKVRPFWHE